MMIFLLRIMFGNTWLLQWKTSKLQKNAKVFAYDSGGWRMRKGPPPWWKSTQICAAMMQSHIIIWYFLISSLYIITLGKIANNNPKVGCTYSYNR